MKLLESDGLLSDHVKFLGGQFAKGDNITPIIAATWLNDELQQFQARVNTTKYMLQQHPAEFVKLIGEYAKKDVGAST